MEVGNMLADGGVPGAAGADAGGGTGGACSGTGGAYGAAGGPGISTAALGGTGGAPPATGGVPAEQVARCRGMNWTLPRYTVTIPLSCDWKRASKSRNLWYLWYLN